MADQLATPEDLAAALQTSVDDAAANVLIECATAVVQAIAGQRIVEVTETVTLDLDGYDGGTYLSLPERPVTAVTSVLIGVTAVTDWTAQLSRSRLWRADGWRSALVGYANQPSSVTVTYTHGYADGDQKLQLARSAVISLAMGALSNPTGATQERIDDYAVTYEAMSSSMQASPFLTSALRKQYGSVPRSIQLIDQGDRALSLGQRA